MSKKNTDSPVTTASSFLAAFTPDSPKFDPEAAAAASESRPARYISTAAPHDFTGKIVSYQIKESKDPKAPRGTELLIVEVEVDAVECGAYQDKGDPTPKPIKTGMILSHLVKMNKNDAPSKLGKVYGELCSITASITGQDEAVYLDGKTGGPAIAEVFSNSDRVGTTVAIRSSSRESNGKTYHNSRFYAA